MDSRHQIFTTFSQPDDTKVYSRDYNLKGIKVQYQYLFTKNVFPQFDLSNQLMVCVDGG